MHIVKRNNPAGATYGICSLATFGTKYVRSAGRTVPDSIETQQDATTELEIEHIYSAVQIGNILDIKMRQKPGTELIWITLDQSENGTRVFFRPDLTTEGDHSLVLESYDHNSRLAVPSTLKTDTIKVHIRSAKCKTNPETSFKFAQEVIVYREYGPTINLP